MGSRAGRDGPKELEKKKRKADSASTEISEHGIRRRAEASTRNDQRYSDILEATQDLEGLNYRPKTAETREIYELLLGIVHHSLGDQAQDVVRSATDTVLEILKSEDMKEFDRKKEVESIMGAVAGDVWSQLINLSKKITDYSVDESTTLNKHNEAGLHGTNLAGEEGVAVLFGDDDEEDDDEGVYEVRDEESDEEDEGRMVEQEFSGPGQSEEHDAGALVLGAPTQPRQAKSSDGKISPHDIDGFWLQRIITSAYPDSIQSAELTSKALECLSSDMDLRDLENSLAETFGYENFELIALLTKNRDAIVWCTKLARSNDEEKRDIEVAMREKGLGWILRSLGSARAHTTVEQNSGSLQDSVMSTADASARSVPTGHKTVDIESLIFTQGGHLMSNKKVKLPQGSFKRTGKGYEEIHVPVPEKRVLAADELPVKIASLPIWTHTVWGKTTQLNPVQSKVYPIAFETDEPMLLCAPTGAGKVSSRYACRDTCQLI
jgi:pre-mRNA-splicing helicase BRR2